MYSWRMCSISSAPGCAQWQAFGQKVAARGGEQGDGVRRSAGLLEAARRRFAPSPDVRPRSLGLQSMLLEVPA
jgi:hypothetical protein